MERQASAGVRASLSLFPSLAPSSRVTRAAARVRCHATRDGLPDFPVGVFATLMHGCKDGEQQVCMIAGVIVCLPSRRQTRTHKHVGPK